ncbi:DNA-dependent RNA polymerase auxiliary subunit epsilon family protein [Halobacillus litoralis]|uniref:DNA-dependent RNA polymerase subunit epsilon n=1 Tax=Halobacillus litoralis TaxID=45668 RepID=UPI001CD2A5E2|nr:DNA-directed RNA polymerase subunit epsilon [Halobacillus litoralis]MCA0969445.1 DNA-dependent RNA polymerase auxiliary subunit epsilon family protein [Halobacillus litoralis]
MIFKVLYQEHKEEVPVRERTQAMYVEAEKEREVRKKLAEKGINIEFIQVLNEDHLAYEQQSEDYAVENV